MVSNLAISKTLAEKVALGSDDPSSNMSQPNLNVSYAVLQQLLQSSTETQEHHWLGVVHVRDVAKAHVSEFAALVFRLFPEFAVHRFDKETQPGLTSCSDAAKRLIELGLVFTVVEDTVKETVQSLRDKGFL